LKHGWMRFWASISALGIVCALAGAQSPSASRSVAKRRVNEFTLAGLRPGLDRAATATRRFKEPPKCKEGDGQLVWEDRCRSESLFLDVDKQGRIQTIRLAAKTHDGKAECGEASRSRWATSNDLAIRDPASRVLKLYGQPDSRSPSTKDGQQLELLYYAFDWAGPTVPQVMEVLCTRDKDGKLGRVVEITLAAASL